MRKSSEEDEGFSWELAAGVVGAKVVRHDAGMNSVVVAKKFCQLG